MQPSNENIQRIIEESSKLLQLADKGDGDRDDESCGVLYGIVRDSAYKMKSQAEQEREKHRKKGTWK